MRAVVQCMFIRYAGVISNNHLFGIVWCSDEPGGLGDHPASSLVSQADFPPHRLCSPYSKRQAPHDSVLRHTERF